MTSAIATRSAHRSRFFVGLLLLAATLLASPCFAANINITWIDMSPILIGGTVPSGSVFNVPGIGNVTVTHNFPAHWSGTRQQSPPNTIGNVTLGPDTYSWTNYEYLGTIFTPGELGPEFSTITYTFPSAQAGGTVFVGTIGLGATTSFGGGASSFSATQNATFIGDYIPGAGFGPTLYTPGFSVKNSLTGPGGSDPWWNTYLGIIRIDDSVSSLTISEGLLRGDGVGINVGFKVPGAVGVDSQTWGGVKNLFR